MTDDPRLEALRHQLKRLWEERDTVLRHRSAVEANRYRVLTTRLIKVLIRIESIEAEQSRQRQGEL